MAQRTIFSLFFFIAVFFTGVLQPFVGLGSIAAAREALPNAMPASSCLSCHSSVQLDAQHSLACTNCHAGDAQASDKESAHQGLLAEPAHPRNMEKTCGQCHGAETKSAAHSSHFLLLQEINMTRSHFGVDKAVTSPDQLAIAPPETSKEALVDDMLRRRCLRCHVYSKGDAYSDIRHGSGCAACHLSFQNGKLISHAFVRPGKKQCLSCHYGNYVGSDFYGYYEHDFPDEYRSPFTKTGLSERPYGLEEHNLAPDIHAQRGLSCLDCHQGFTHREKAAITCHDCHAWSPGMALPRLRTLSVAKDQLILTDVTQGKKHVVPALRHPAHKEYGNRVDCQVCHAQWSYNDTESSLLLSYSADVEEWTWLTVQGSSEIEKRLEDLLFGNDTDTDPAMRDGLTGELRPGFWLKGYYERRWERMIIQKDADGKLKVFRPILNLRLSLLQADGTVPFNNIKGRDAGLRPYVPHTTGPAGLFYLNRLSGLADPE